MSLPFSDGGTGVAGRRIGNLVSSFVFSVLCGVLFIGAPIYFAGIWEVLANTRLLDVLISGGIIAYHDMDPGFIKGVADHKYYLMSQDFIDWRLVLFAVTVVLLMFVLKALLFHGNARIYGLQGTFGQHARAYFYGLGLNRFLPFNLGSVGTAAALTHEGASLERAASAVFLSELFVIFEIFVLAMIGFLTLGWSTWLSQIFWALVILAVLYAMFRSGSGNPIIGFGSLGAARQAFRALGQKPMLLVWLCLLALVTSLLFKVASYAVVMAFDSEFVLLKITPSLIAMGLVGGLIASLIPLTPGGIGQFELGAATALTLGGMGLAGAATVAILTNLTRLVAGLLLLVSVVVGPGVKTNLGSVLNIFMGGDSQPEQDRSQ